MVPPARRNAHTPKCPRSPLLYGSMLLSCFHTTSEGLSLTFALCRAAVVTAQAGPMVAPTMVNATLPAVQVDATQPASVMAVQPMQPAATQSNMTQPAAAMTNATQPAATVGGQ